MLRPGLSSAELIHLTEKFGAHNYAPLPVVIASGKGAWLKDVEGRDYLDMLSAYSAMNFGHGNPKIIEAAKEQLDTLTLTSRAFYNNKLGVLCQRLAEMTGLDMALPMNSGAEAVETALKAVRKWGEEVKGVPENSAEIICFEGNFAGRTISIVSFSTSEKSRRGFGPFTPGFKLVPFGDIEALKSAITKNTVGVLVEPIQGEGGVIIPPYGYLKAVRELCILERVAFIGDEIQTGLCRTGALFACDHEKVTPDLMLLGKSLGGGIVPVSAVVGKREIMEVFTPGTHGSTFGGSPFACAVALAVLDLIEEERPHERARELGAYFLKALCDMRSPKISAIRGRGLMVGADIKPEFGKAKGFCEELMRRGILCKDTRDQTIRFAPPLTISKEDLDWGLERIAPVFK